MTYARAFFELQLRFAHRVSVLSGMPLPRALLEYTNFYIRFGFGRDFDPAHPGWQEYLAGLRNTNDTLEWTYRFQVARSPAVAPPSVVATFGCFAYGRLGPDRIRLHFQNSETDGHAPLGLERRGQRLAELVALFEHVNRNMPRADRVVGASWLYNLDAYRRLFPESYVATAHVIPHRFQHMPLWGQFVDRHGEIRKGVTRQFLEHLGRQSSLESLDECFPFPVLAVEASVRDFCQFYGGPPLRTGPTH